MTRSVAEKLEVLSETLSRLWRNLYAMHRTSGGDNADKFRKRISEESPDQKGRIRTHTNSDVRVFCDLPR